MKNDYDIIIVGGGPAGSAAALYLAEQNLQILLLEKESFKRDKTCGDAFSAYSVNRLNELGLTEKFLSLETEKITSILFSAPNGKSIALNTTEDTSGNVVTGYTCRRDKFDEMILREASSRVKVLTSCQVIDLTSEKQKITGVIVKKENGDILIFKSKIVIGADGYGSLIARKSDLANYTNNKNLLIAARGYYENVELLPGTIEMHYCRNLIPGYLWIFPSTNNSANVGVCIPKYLFKKNKITPSELLKQCLQKQPFIERFADATLQSRIESWPLPAGNSRKVFHKNGVLLIGDAAGLIDPLSGEGIGNAMTSAKIASETLKKLFSETEHPELHLNLFTHNLLQKMGRDFSLSGRLLQLMRYPSLINFVINKARKSEFVAQWLAAVVSDTSPRKDLYSIKTYLKLLFA